MYDVYSFKVLIRQWSLISRLTRQSLWGKFFLEQLSVFTELEGSSSSSQNLELDPIVSHVILRFEVLAAVEIWNVILQIVTQQSSSL